MPTSLASPSVEQQVYRIRELSREGRHVDALRAAEALAKESPLNRDALYLAAANLRCMNQTSEALHSLQRLEQHHPLYSLLHQERGYCYLMLRDAPRAIESFHRAVSLNPALVASWSMLGRLYHMAGDEKGATLAAQQFSILQHLPAEIVRAGGLFLDGDLDIAEEILRSFLCHSGEHVEALRLLARITHQRGSLDEAEGLLEAAVQQTPEYRAARLDYVRVLIDAQKYLQAKDAVRVLLDSEPGNRDYRSLFAAASAGLGQLEAAVALYSDLLAETPESWELHMALGHSLKSSGRISQAIESYRQALAAKPGFGDAWWSLANLKSYRFSDADLNRMGDEEADPKSNPADRLYICFALGKAYEDRHDFARSWRFYERGNALMRAKVHYDPEIMAANARKQTEVCTAQFFAAHSGAGVSDRDPIFIVGLPRSGSTLIEQILASHSQVDGTQELPDIPRIAFELENARGNHVAGIDLPYPEVLAGLTREGLYNLGARYLANTRGYRGQKPLFIDKMPNNFRHIGLIHLMLPNATIIDVRREPMSCCFSNLKQLFASGQEFTYSMDDIAGYYRAYLELMRHWDMALPGRVLHVFYEDVVDDLEGNVRRILEFCGLNFEPECLEFYKTERSVRTPSSEQVRKPIFREGLNQWQNYEPWLSPLKDALGDAVIRYRI